MCTVYRMIAAAMWAVSACLAVLGLIESQNSTDFYAWSLLMAIGGSIFTGWLVIRWELDRATSRAEETVSEAVAYAVGKEISESRVLQLH